MVDPNHWPSSHLILCHCHLISVTRSCCQMDNLFCTASGGKSGAFHLQELLCDDLVDSFLCLLSHSVLYILLSLLPDVNKTCYSYVARILQVIKHGHIFGPNSVFLPPQTQVSELSLYKCTPSRHVISMIIQPHSFTLHFYTFPCCSSFDVPKASSFI